MAHVLVGTIVDDLIRTGSGLVQSGSSVVQTQGSAVAQQLLHSTEFDQVLNAVQLKAQAAVVEETKKNAVALFALAIGGGAIGGMIFKGWAGAAMAAGLMVWAGSTIVQGAQAPKKK